jgi:glutathione synthase/RimK-type ligase-like ATP-grasp enzyme
VGKNSMIIILGTYEDRSTTYIYEKLQARHLPVTIFNTLDYPRKVTLNFQPESPQSGTIRFLESNLTIPVSDIQSVYWRTSSGVEYVNTDNEEESRIIYWNNESGLKTFLYNLHCTWVNSPQAIDLHAKKGYQLQLLAEKGIRIPKTLITNDANEVLAFKEALKIPLIYKPVRGGAHTAMLTDKDLTPERLSSLAFGPIKLQECVTGVDIRVYCFEDELFAVEIQSSTLDFREDPSAKRVAITLPDSVIADCFAVAKTLGLIFTGIDLRRTPDGEYIFFEANPCPIFIGDEIKSGHPITAKLIDLLAQPAYC